MPMNLSLRRTRGVMGAPRRTGTLCTPCAASRPAVCFLPRATQRRWRTRPAALADVPSSNPRVSGLGTRTSARTRAPTRRPCAAHAGPLAAVQAAVSAHPVWAALLGAAAFVAVLAKSFSRGSRKYAGNVGEEYDAWAKEGILEHYWGEHIHLGYYSAAERQPGFFAWGKKNFIQAKYDFIDEMLKWSGTRDPKSILDVGCGWGGTSRRLASLYPDTEVKAITLSGEQVRRGNELSRERGLSNVEMRVMDALDMAYPDNSFDLVWACESGEHMPDKKKYVDEMIRVLKPGGTLVIACWCQREQGDKPFTAKEKSELQFLYDEWAHPYFISKEEFVRLITDSGVMADVVTENWVDETLPSWRQSVWVGVESPWYVLSKLNLRIWWKVVRDIVCLERMHQAFKSGLMEYGMMKAVKTADVTSKQRSRQPAVAA